MFITIDIYSKNLQSIKNFLKFFREEKAINKLIVLKTEIKKFNNKQVFTVLKSPHVNKSAQEHFKVITYKKRIKIFVYKFNLFLLILKKIKFNFFIDLNFKIWLNLNLPSKIKKTKLRLNINNYKLCKKKNLNVIKYLKSFEALGELKEKIGV